MNLKVSNVIKVTTVLTVYGIETLQRWILYLVWTILVTTVLTVYGIETLKPEYLTLDTQDKLQQYLPFTVLKLALYCASNLETNLVTTVLTVYGIETLQPLALLEQRKSVTTVLTVYGIETKRRVPIFYSTISTVTTVLTVYGIETKVSSSQSFSNASGYNSTYRLRYWNSA